ncbi:hypothetical protein [Noviherbaspirillum galbum]|uniref:Uncharacterized protein n=1 Tax=Noviherbaspirillum galbum TaxID=2709383 RepID=A0A6B3SPW0_9BURK|nr:hypothetical protein [Noviherbaspirillum galbum]NEX60442.1 hypothetical protein [Noviherbaspirillum galbum]
MISKIQRLSIKPILGLAFLCAVPFASANDVGWSVTLGTPAPVYSPPPVVYAPQPVYTRPAPVYVQPAPVYVQPRPVYVRPSPVYVQPGAYVQYGAPVVVEERWYHKHHHGRGHAYGHWKD